ncbi:MAG: hypothetical protein PUK35_04430 [Methanomassiliicoccales archaeon]|nr:hypothetical protein [Methanomassiliicoccales archaeon]MDD7479081.1 hypothetical protein [Methanomassiliicoccales archaeon]
MDTKMKEQAAKRCSVSLGDTGGISAFEGFADWNGVKKTNEKEVKNKENLVYQMQSGRVGP